MTELLRVEGLSVSFRTDEGPVRAVRDVAFTVRPNEVFGVVGESGSGKSVTAMAVLGLLPRSASVEGSVRLAGEELVGADERAMRSVRGNRVAIVFQDALAALNPVLRIGDQIAEAVTAHRPEVGRADLKARVIELLELVGIPRAAERADQYPHEFSGGMRQRVMIAMAIANDPALLIADEPTTALDVTIQAQVLDVLDRVRERTDAAIMLITHDLGVVAGMADRVLVMYAGRPVELGGVEDIFYRSGHPYTLSLLASMPRIDRRVEGERLYRIPGAPPSQRAVPPGCAFHPRCFRAELPSPCATDRPELRLVPGSAAQVAACHFAGEVSSTSPQSLRTAETP